MKIIFSLIFLLFSSFTINAQFPTIPGRIAISSDGNNHDCDDLVASAMTVALIAKSGNASKLVYYGHSDHIWSSDTVETCSSVTQREVEMQVSSEGTAHLYGGFDLTAFINAKANTSGAVAKLVSAINASSVSDPLWIIAAGPMEVVGQALNNSNANKQFVTVISHSTWNDDHADNPEGGEVAHSGWTWTELQAAFTTVTFKHIADQNAGLNVPASNYSWLQNSYDPKLVWLWNRYLLTGIVNFDPSDAGMFYWLLTGGGQNTGDEGATPRKLRFILEPFVFPSSGGAWDTATPAEMGFNTTQFNAALANLPDKTIVIKNGYVIATKGNVATTGFIWSASKSMVALIFGREHQKGNVTYDATVPNSNVPGNPLATHRQFLNMTSDYSLTPHAPGTHFGYNNSAWHFFGTYLKDSFYPGRTHVETLQDAFVTELGFQNSLTYPSSTFAGLNHMSGWNGGWSMSSQDIARIAYLVLRKGKWKDKQLISIEHTNNLWRNQTPATATQTTDESDEFTNQPSITVQLPGGHSYGTWISSSASVTDLLQGSVINEEAISFLGAFGTGVHISRKHDLIVATVNTGGETTNPSDRVSGDEFNALVASLESEQTFQNNITYYVRNGGSNTTNCTGQADLDYDGSGTNENCAFSNPMDAVRALNYGDFFKFKAGQTFDTPGAFLSFDLGDKGAPPTNTDADYITITTTDPSGTPAALSNYPESDTRITTAMAANMPRIRTIGSFPVFWINKNAKYWIIERLDITDTGGPSHSIRLIGLGEDPPTTVEQYPDRIKIRLNWIHPSQETGTALDSNNIRRTSENGIYLEGTNILIAENAIQGFVGRNSIADGGGTLTSAGHLMTTWSNNVIVERNLIEAWTYSVFYGGGSEGIATQTATVSSCNSTSCVFSNTTGLSVGEPVAVLVYSFIDGQSILRNVFGTAYVQSIVGSTVNFAAPLCNSDNTGGNGNVCMPFDGNNLQQIPSNGNVARWDGVQIQNVLVRLNILAHRPEWAAQMDNGCGGKGYLELKACKDCTFDANIFKGCTGSTTTVRNQGGADPWYDLDNLTFSNNYYHNANNAFVAYLNDIGNLTSRSVNVTFFNNLVTGEYADPNEFNHLRIISGYFGGGQGTKLIHNTILIGSWSNFQSFSATQSTMLGLEIRDNIIRAAANPCEGSSSITSCWPSADIHHNVLMHIDTNATLEDINNSWLTPFPNNSYTSTVSGMGFIDPTPALDSAGNYRLSLSSPFKNTASDGTDPGVNFTTFVNAFGFDPTGGGGTPVSNKKCNWHANPKCDQ